MIDIRGEAIPGEEGLMDDLPRSIKEELYMKRCGKLLNKVSFLNDIYLVELRELSTLISIYRFSSGDIIMYCGDMWKELYCVRKGHVEVIRNNSLKVYLYRYCIIYHNIGSIVLFICLSQILSEDSSRVVSMKQVGSYFGTSGFLMGMPTKNTVRAASNCELVMLKREDADKIPNIQR